MPNNSLNVSMGKPKIGGAVFIAPLGTNIPENATAELDSAFKCLGYVSEDGVTNTNSPSSEKVKAWGGDTVSSLQSEKPDEWKMKLIESMNIDVLKAVYGDSNVTGSAEQGIKVSANSKEAGEMIWVIDMMMKGNVPRRIVIPQGKLTALEDIVYKDTEAVGYGITVTAMPDTDENTHYDYLYK